MLKNTLATIFCFLCMGAILNAEDVSLKSDKDATFSKRPSVVKTPNGAKVHFELNKKSDVEIAILNADGIITRHLAAGLLGGEQIPPPPFKVGLLQEIEWDGKDDYGQIIANVAGCSVRVRLGMGVKLDTIVGGNPYAFWSPYSGQGDHTQWEITGVEAKKDGNVYLLGSVTPFGLPALRKYDAKGNFLNTVFPIAAGKPLEEVQGWGVNVRADGAYALKLSYGWGATVSAWTLLWGGRDSGGIWHGRILPTTNNNSLCVVAPLSWNNKQMTFGTDGSHHKFEPTELLKGEPLPKKNFIDATFTALSPDGKSYFLSGFGTTESSFWQDGQIWKVDIATKTPTIFFGLTEEERKDRSAIGNTASNPYTAFHGVAVDKNGVVFICDRLMKRIAIVGKDGKLIRSIPVLNPDAIAVNPNSKAVYVTTRFGNYNGNGEINLLKFNDWTKDDAPSATLPLCSRVGSRKEITHLTVVEDKGEVLVWAVYTTLPARVYKDTATGLELIKDFITSGTQQNALDMQSFQIDKKTGDAYIADSQGHLFRLRNWKTQEFEPCLLNPTTKINASSIAIDSHSRYLYTKSHYNNFIRRWAINGDFFSPAPVGEPSSNTQKLSGKYEFSSPTKPFGLISLSMANEVAPPVTCGWVFTGIWERGMAAGPGGLATLGAVLQDGTRIDDYSGPLTYFKPDKTKAPWQGLFFSKFGKREAGGVRFDVKGNLYAGVLDGKPDNIPKGFENDTDYLRLGRIYKYCPTGTLESGDLFPSEPTAPNKIYNIHYGPINQAPHFGVDDYGRIYYPNALLSQVAVIDNEGNPLIAFGTYGNRDSMGGLIGDLVPTKDIPLAWPNCVDVTDDYIYVGDRANVRLLRLSKTFQVTETVGVK
jgi:DNA-binding beta-propeller fold protein YncE